MHLGYVRFWAAIAARVALVALVVIALTLGGEWVEHRFAGWLDLSGNPMRWAVIAAIAAYVVLLAVPFVPGVEIGLTLLAIFGREIALVIYGATVLALLLSFLLGRLVPHRVAARFLDGLRLRRAAALLREVEAVAPEERLSFLLQSASSGLAPLLLRHRHLALIVTLNMPGNALVGGGGGIGLVAGISRVFGLADYMLTIAIAVAPVPLVVLLFGG